MSEPNPTKNLESLQSSSKAIMNTRMEPSYLQQPNMPDTTGKNEVDEPRVPNDDPKKLEELEKKVDILLEKMEKLEKLDKKALQMAKNKLNAQRGQRTPIDSNAIETDEPGKKLASLLSETPGLLKNFRELVNENLMENNRADVDSIRNKFDLILKFLNVFDARKRHGQNMNEKCIPVRNKKTLERNRKRRDLNKECRELNKECRKLNKECRHLINESPDFDRDSCDLNKECRDLNQECRDLNQECRDLNKESPDLNTRSLDLIKERRDLNKEYRDLNKVCRDLNKECRELSKNGCDLNEECRDLNQFDPDLNDDDIDLNEERSVLSKEWHDLSKESSDFIKECGDLNKECSDLIKSCRGSNNENPDLKKNKCRDLKEKCLELNKEGRCLNKDSIDLIKECRELKKECEDLKALCASCEFRSTFQLVLWCKEKVHNVKGSSNDDRKTKIPRSWKDIVKELKTTLGLDCTEICQILDCPNTTNIVGGHMEKHIEDPYWYILPICNTHNQRDTYDPEGLVLETSHVVFAVRIEKKNIEAQEKKACKFCGKLLAKSYICEHEKNYCPKIRSSNQ
ncbi:uveal autoantigen with coiled-coil domains and ankyrin repeats protein-like [Symsagittifera roscoffensis]|uniref:uveal autoantigen with coiled-coil domains and ankyrin repeats protein-like n=1 Tax=Symsagittifera roscoffensis TaxID=84072 RepID=UPI00307C91C4